MIEKNQTTKLDEETQLKIVEDYKVIKSIRKLAAKYGVSTGSISSYLYNHGVRSNRRIVLDIKKQLELVEDFKSVGSTTPLVSKYGISKRTVLNYLHFHGIDTSYRYTSPAIRLKMVDEYLAGYSAEEVGLKLGFSRGAVFKALEDRGIESRTIAQARREYPLVEDFFERIDSEEKAYWLGFILADGCVRMNTEDYLYVLSIRLAYKDRDHLVKFLRSLQTKKPIYDGFTFLKGKKLAYSDVNISSKKMVLDLNRLGVTSRKSLTAMHIKVPTDLEHHYFRGLIDGDGCISSTVDKRNGKRYWKVALVGSYDVVDNFSRFISNRLGSAYNVPSANGKIFQTSCSGFEHPAGLAEVLYSNSSIFLERKKQRAEQLIKIYRGEEMRVPNGY